jgi:hypothetical protein
MIVSARLPAHDAGTGRLAGAVRAARKSPSEHYAPNAGPAL